VERENWLPWAGLLFVFAVASVMLYATSGPPKAPAEGTPRGEKAAKTPAKAAKKPVPKLTARRPVGDRPAATEGAHNVVFVVACAHRRDRWTPYGGDEMVTPFLDTFGAEGVIFDDVIAASSWSKPAVTALWTGQHAVDIDMVEPGRKPNSRTLKPEVETLAKRLVAGGYYTMIVNTSPSIARPGAGLFRGFDRVRDAHPQGFQVKNRLRSLPAVEEALKMLDQRNEGEESRPFYLQLVLSESHKPVQVPPDEYTPFASSDERIAPYLATVNRFDRAVAALDAGLEERGLADDTLFVVVADHGEGLGIPEAHGKAHGRGLYGSSVRVGWLMRGPSIPAGTTVSGLASGVDVMPTVLGLLDVEVPADLPGQDWSAQARGKKAATTRKVAYADTWFYGANRASAWTSTHQCQRDFGSIDVKDQFQDGCFDRGSDPDFVTPMKKADLDEKLTAWRSARTVSGVKGPRSE